MCASANIENVSFGFDLNAVNYNISLNIDTYTDIILNYTLTDNPDANSGTTAQNYNFIPNLQTSSIDAFGDIILNSTDGKVQIVVYPTQSNSISSQTVSVFITEKTTTNNAVTQTSSSANSVLTVSDSSIPLPSAFNLMVLGFASFAALHLYSRHKAIRS
jgi:hypothetical protein